MKRLLIEEIEKLDRNFLTPAEAAAAMEISLSTFYRNREKMNLPTVRSGRKIHIPKDAFIEFLRYGKTGDRQKIKNLRITHIHRAIQKIEYNLAYRVIRSFFVYSFTGA